MPPVTPSPHRFLPGQKRQQPPPHAGRQSNEAMPQQRRLPAQRHATSQRPTSLPSTTRNGDQFAQTPRFSFGRPARRERSPKPNLAQALRHSTRPTEDVEEAPLPDVVDEEMLEIDYNDVRPTTEVSEQQQSYYPQAWSNDLPYSPKRRKLQEDAQRNVQSLARPPVFKHPTTPASHFASGAHHYVRAGSVASSVASNDTNASRRPAFLRSSLAPAEQHEPLPEVFSPHRRGEKFVPGGMAATLQQWVIETGQAAAQSRRGQGYLGGEDYVYRIEIESCSGTGPVMVQGKRWDGEQISAMLVVNAKRGAVEVHSGGVVGVRAPTWEVCLDGKRWQVAVDWRSITSR